MIGGGGKASIGVAQAELNRGDRERGRIDCPDS